jgi:hypothetical protein
MATKSSYFLAVLLIANPFMLLVFQNCTPSAHAEREVASIDSQSSKPVEEPEFSASVNKNLKIK